MKPFTTLTVFLLAVVALAHALRLVRGFQVIVGHHVIPQWTSIVGLVVAAGLSAMVWRESRR